MSTDVQITLVGNISSDLELKFSASSVAFVKFSVAVNERKKERGEWVDGTTSYYDCTAFNKFAENIAASLRKGDRVFIRGSMQQEHWEKEGQKRSKHTIIVDDCGPELKWAEVTGLKKNEKGSGRSEQRHADDGQPDPDPQPSGSPFG